jgi:hypothetical protein
MRGGGRVRLDMAKTPDEVPEIIKARVSADITRAYEGLERKSIAIRSALDHRTSSQRSWGYLSIDARENDRLLSLGQSCHSYATLFDPTLQYSPLLPLDGSRAC